MSKIDDTITAGDFALAYQNRFNREDSPEVDKLLDTCKDRLYAPNEESVSIFAECSHAGKARVYGAESDNNDNVSALFHIKRKDKRLYSWVREVVEKWEKNAYSARKCKLAFFIIYIISVFFVWDSEFDSGDSWAKNALFNLVIGGVVALAVAFFLVVSTVAIMATLFAIFGEFSTRLANKKLRQGVQHYTVPCELFGFVCALPRSEGEQVLRAAWESHYFGSEKAQKYIDSVASDYIARACRNRIIKAENEKIREELEALAPPVRNIARDYCDDRWDARRRARDILYCLDNTKKQE